VRKQLVEEGFESVLSRKTRRACGSQDFRWREGSQADCLGARWTLRLLENKVVELNIVDRASDSTIGRTLKKTFSSRI
jgi:hypothetical protein